jgi:hypothetical protein
VVGLHPADGGEQRPADAALGFVDRLLVLRAGVGGERGLGDAARAEAAGDLVVGEELGIGGEAGVHHLVRGGLVDVEVAEEDVVVDRHPRDVAGQRHRPGRHGADHGAAGQRGHDKGRPHDQDRAPPPAPFPQMAGGVLGLVRLAVGVGVWRLRHRALS